MILGGFMGKGLGFKGKKIFKVFLPISKKNLRINHTIPPYILFNEKNKPIIGV